jgi:hypothetical protein
VIVLGVFYVGVFCYSRKKVGFPSYLGTPMAVPDTTAKTCGGKGGS